MGCRRAGGLLIGLTRGTNRAHIARAALESIAFQTADLIDAMRQDAGCAFSELRVDGGAARNDLLLQFQADMLGVPVLRPTTPRPRRSAPRPWRASAWAVAIRRRARGAVVARTALRTAHAAAEAALRRAPLDQALERARHWARDS
jgi:glycerol kinase